MRNISQLSASILGAPPCKKDVFHQNNQLDTARPGSKMAHVLTESCSNSEACGGGVPQMGVAQ